MALLVAIDSYPIVQGRQLSGSNYDLRLMKAMLDCYAFKTDELARSQATHRAVLAKLDALATAAKSGDEVVFYFSGRGSIAPPPGQPNVKVNLEPTLVCYDGEADGTGYDVRMSVLEDWAKKITDKGAQVTIIVDASFESAARDDVGRPYNPMPRTIQRKSTMDGQVRDQPYLGPGIYIAATPSGGSAYEYLINASKDTWDGAFTDMFVNEVIAEIHKGAVPTYSGVMREVEAYFKDKVRQDYMPGLAPYPFTKDLVAKADIYDKPMFGGLTPNAIPPPQQAVVQQMDDAHKKQESKLRIGLSFPSVRGSRAVGNQDAPVARDATDMEKDRDPQLVDATTKYVAANMPYAEVEPVGAPIDVIVTLVKDTSGTGIEARIAGNEVDAEQNLRFTGNSVDDLMKAGLSDQLERKALSQRLFNLLDTTKPTWDDGAASLTADKDTYKPGELVKLDFKCSGPALLYVFNRDDADGIIQITFPALGATDNLLAGGNAPQNPTIDQGSPTGKMLVRALYVEPSPDVTIPPIPKDTDQKVVLTALLAQLRILVPAIESNKLRWTIKELTLTVSS